MSLTLRIHANECALGKTREVMDGTLRRKVENIWVKIRSRWKSINRIRM